MGCLGALGVGEPSWLPPLARYRIRPAPSGRAGVPLAGARQATGRTATPCGRQMGLGLGHGVLAPVEDRGGQHGVGPAGRRPLHEMVERAHPARGHHRHPDGVDHGPGQLEVEAVAGPVAVHRGEQDLAGPQPRRSARPRPRRRPPVGRRPPWVYTSQPAPVGPGPGVDGHHHALGAELAGQLGHELGALEGGRVDGHLVGPGPQQAARVLGAAHPAAHGEGDEHLLGRAGHHRRPWSRARRRTR